MCTSVPVWYAGTDGTLVFSLFSFLPPRPLQQAHSEASEFAAAGDSPAKQKCRAVPNLGTALHGVWEYGLPSVVWD